MSYCRWSDDDYKCDVYVYQSASCGGYVTHVAGSRYVFKAELPAPVKFSDIDAWIARHKAISDMVDDADMEPIGLPHDGEDFTDTYPEDCANRLERLRALGYNVPQYAIDSLREEQVPP